jgi:gustatory receptor
MFGKKINVENLKINSSFCETSGKFFAFSQFFGMLPVINVTKGDESKLRFSWKSKRTIYSIIFILCGSLEGVLAIKRLMRRQFSIHFTEGVSFFVTTIIRAIIVFKIAIKWKEIMLFWRRCEDPFLRNPYCEKGWKLEKKCSFLFKVFIFQVFCKHFL